MNSLLNQNIDQNTYNQLIKLEVQSLEKKVEELEKIKLDIEELRVICGELLKRVEVLENARKNQITLNTDLLKKTEVKPEGKHWFDKFLRR